MKIKCLHPLEEIEEQILLRRMPRCKPEHITLVEMIRLSNIGDVVETTSALGGHRVYYHERYNALYQWVGRYFERIKSREELT